MGVRKTVNDHPAAFASIAGGFCLFMTAFLFWERAGAKTPVLLAYGNKAFYSDDDGQTWFMDEAAKLRPFDHNGKQAYRAMLFRCGTGKPFVGFLSKYSDTELKNIAALRAAAAQRDPNRTQTGAPPPEIPLDLKKPGDAHWLPATAAASAAYRQLLAPACPDGSRATAVSLTDADAH